MRSQADAALRLAGVTLEVADAGSKQVPGTTRVALTEGWVELSADLIDTSAERERLTKQHGELEATLTRAAKKLANEGFLAKAAPEVVAHEREKHDRLVSQLAEVDAQLAELG